MTKKRYCPECDAPLIAYTHSLSATLCRVLSLLATAGGYWVHPGRDCVMTHAQRANLNKLAYWGFIEQSDPSNPRGGCWNVTDLGMLFLCGKRSAPKKAITFRGKDPVLDGDHVYIYDVLDGWMWRPDYARESIDMFAHLGVSGNA